MLQPSQLAAKIGKNVLFIGTECQYWAVSDFAKAAANARAMGFDTIAPKRADGGIRWYGTPGHLALERQAVLAAGCGYLPFMYCYGPALGYAQINYEVTVAKEIAAACDGLVCMDLEVEWDGQTTYAQNYAAALQNFPGDIILSTWADPIQQNWLGVIQAFNPVVSAWGPQQYTLWLALQEGQLTSDGVPSGKIFPEIDMVDLFGGANDPLTVMHDAVNRGHGSVWVWEYLGALGNPNLAKAITALLGSKPSPLPPTPTGKPVTLPPVKVPSPNHGSGQTWKTYTIVSGDSLSIIALRLGLANWFQDLYQPNAAEIEARARANGLANSSNGASIFPGTVLRYLK